ncbi:MAG: FecR domain-containing protein [Spirochaetaceae bacterium]|nr:FecR domain-containing protein [Spirochaetaceae bacterium]
MTKMTRFRFIPAALMAAGLVSTLFFSSCGPLGNIADRLGLNSLSSADSAGGAERDDAERDDAERDGILSRFSGAPSEVGEIVYLEGPVSLNDQTASIGESVMDGDVVFVGEGGLAEIEFGEYRILRASENARLVIDSERRTMNLETGGVAVVQSKAPILSRRKPWMMETPTTIAAVRGTLYYTRVEDSDTTYFCLCNGRIHLEDETGFVDLAANHHKAVRAKRSGGDILYEQAPLLYHDDEGMESLADMVYVPVDWTQISF